MTTETQMEVELKLRLSESIYNEMRVRLGQPQAVIEQTNVYFDTPTLIIMRERKLMVRVRQAERLEVTVKDRVADPGDGVLRTRERTAELSEEQWHFVSERHTQLTNLDIELCKTLYKELGEHLFIAGLTRNLREVYPLGDGYLAEVDRTEFPDNSVHFEVELELRDPAHTLRGARDALAAALPSIDVNQLRPSSSKYGRFLKAINAPR
jgi:uncharacterized protein YjbK